MKLSEELRRRIRQLEVEQERQQKDLTNLDQFRDLAAIAELENELKNIDKATLKKAIEAELGSDISLEAEQELADMVKQAKSSIAKTVAQPAAVHDIDLSQEQLNGSDKAKSVKGGFSVCLVFNPQTPSEWSEEGGGGWRGKGLGTHYATREEAEKRLQELKKKWPEYPLRIM